MSSSSSEPQREDPEVRILLCGATNLHQQHVWSGLCTQPTVKHGSERKEAEASASLGVQTGQRSKADSKAR